DAADHRLVSDVDQALRPPGGLPGDEHAARIAMPAVHDQRYVDIEDVPVAQRLFVGYAMAHDVVDRDAPRLAIAAVVQGRGIGVMVAGELKYEPVEARGRDPWLDERSDQVERFR